VKTPLNAVVNCLEIALEKPLDQETKDILTDSHNASKSLIYVIDDLLHLTDTIYQAPLATTFDTFKLRESVLSTLHSLHIYATRKSLSFIIEWDDVMPTVFRGNLQRLQLAITQIVANAIQYTEEGGIKIHVGARPITDKDYIVHIAVQDTGTGLAEDDLDKLFQEFEQVADEDFQVTGTSEHVTTAPSSGVPKKSELGLGLALVARYIKQCGGQIRVISNMGKGSTFALDVPLTLGEEADVITPGTFAERDSNMRHGKSLSSAASTTSQPSTALVLRHAAQSPDHAPAAQSHVQDFDVVSPNDVSRATLITPKMKSLVVLVVDDNPVNVRILKRRLERMGHEVKTSLGGQECFEVFQNHFEAVECILMDINVRTRSLWTPLTDSSPQMPLVDGIQATKMIRQFETSLPTSNSTIDASTFVERSTTQLPFSPISPPPTNSRTAHDLDSDDYFALPLSPPKADTVPRYESIAPPSAPSSKADPTDRARIQGRLPIFAVSASLERHTQESLSAAGLDGWLSKPIDFKRLGVILEGVVSREARWQAKSATGDFKRGGWFE
jgi:CheY-like chemotaxis protein/two-component sensor histidine kinase